MHAVLLLSLILSGCLVRQNEDIGKGGAEARAVSPDREIVTANGDIPDPSRARALVLFKIAQDCLAKGYTTFAFTSVAQPKPHLPNEPPDAPVQYLATTRFKIPSTIVPEIDAGTSVGVKFFKAGDPAGADAIYANLIVANLAPNTQH